jgi:hypothetical protein
MAHARQLVGAREFSKSKEERQKMESIFESIYAFFGNFPAWLNAILAVISAASAITALTPTPKDDQFVGRLYKILEVLALNIGKAKDKAPNTTAKP